MFGVQLRHRPLAQMGRDFFRAHAFARHVLPAIRPNQKPGWRMRGYTRVIHPNACLNSVFNAFRNDEVVVRLIIAGGEGRGEDNALNARRETRRKKLRRSHVEIPSDAPRPPTHFELVLEMVEHDPINSASAMFPVLQIDGETYEAAI